MEPFQRVNSLVDLWSNRMTEASPAGVAVRVWQVVSWHALLFCEILGVTVHVVVARNHRINYSKIGVTFQHVLFHFVLFACVCVYVCISNTWMMDVSIYWTLSYDIHSFVFTKSCSRSCALSVTDVPLNLDAEKSHSWYNVREGG